MSVHSLGSPGIRPWIPRAALALAALPWVVLSQCPTDGGNEPPPQPGNPVALIADLGGAALLQLGDSAALDGSASHLGENTGDLDLVLSFFWELESKPEGSALADESLLQAEGDPAHVTLLPDVQGIYGVTLQVGDGTRLSDDDHVLIQVGGGNTCPTADAGVDRVAQTSVPVTLDGSASSDPEITAGGDDDDSAAEQQVLGYAWHFSLVPAESQLDDGDLFYQGTEHPVFIPDVAGTFILQLRVDDGLCASLPDYVAVQVSNGNQPPVADAGSSQLLTPCSPTEVGLDGSASYDPEGQSLNYRWSFTSVPSGSAVADAFLEDRFTSTPKFNWDVPGIYTLELRVDDGAVDSQPDYVAVQAIPPLPNGAPVALADDQVVTAQAACTSDPYSGGTCSPCGSRTVLLSAEGSWDPDGDGLNFQWDLQSGSAELLGVTSNVLEVTLPSLPVSYNSTSTVTVQVGLTVFDCRGADDDTVTITFICDGIP
jgi:hypothetical protein